MPISQNLNYSFLSYPEKRYGDNAIITFEETKVFEIEKTSFLSIVKLYKTRDWGWLPSSTKKKATSKYILLFFIFYLSQFLAHIHRVKRAKSLQKVKQNCEYMLLSLL